MPDRRQPTVAWPADKVERRAVASLIPYARNARTHSPDQIEMLAKSIRQWGWTVPVLVDETGMIIAGHGRVMAAQKLGLAEVPVMVASGWTDDQKCAYVLADNKLPEHAGWNEQVLAFELGELADAGFDIGLTGFDPPGADGGAEPQRAEIVDAPMSASFWIAIEGPLLHQAAALHAIKELSKLTGIEVHSNLREEV